LNGPEKVDRYLIEELLLWVDCNARTKAKLIYGNRMINACSLTSYALVLPIGRYAAIHRPFDFINICMKIKGHAIQCHRRYGSVFDTSYHDWSNMNRIKFKNDSKPAIQLLDGSQAGVIKSDDQFIHLPKGHRPN
jgi:hypothetical protein